VIRSLLAALLLLTSLAPAGAARQHRSHRATLANGGQMATGVAVSRRTLEEIQQLEDRGLRSDILNGLHIEVRDELPDDTFNFNGLTPSCL
jgi:hypothetical protein